MRRRERGKKSGFRRSAIGSRWSVFFGFVSVEESGDGRKSKNGSHHETEATKKVKIDKWNEMKRVGKQIRTTGSDEYFWSLQRL